MFLTRRKICMWLCCLLSSLLFSLSFSPWPLGRQGALNTTEPLEGTLFTSPIVNPSTTAPAGYILPLPSNTIPAGVRTARPTSNAPEDDPSTLPDRRLLPYLKAAGYFLSAVFGMVFLFARQEIPLAGPEADLIMWNLFSAVLWRIKKATPSFLLTLLCALLVCCILIATRDLLWWMLHKFSAAWSSCLRLTQRALLGFGHRGYLLALTGITAGCVCGIVGLAFGGFGWLTLCCLALLLGLYFCIRQFFLYGKHTDHLVAQIQSLYDGTSVTQEAGIFAPQENQLAGLRKQMDEAVNTALTGERFKVELISNVSHDLRTPLTAILGYAELMQQQTLPQQAQQSLNKLTQKAGYMRDLVDTVFDLTKVSSGSIQPNWESIDLIRLLEQTIGLFDDELSAQGLDIRRHYVQEHLPVRTDGSLLHQIVANLIANAVKYALPGSRVHLHAYLEDSVFTIRLTNIASYEMDFHPEEILQRFVRGDKARTSQGSGIGLAIAQTYSQALGGSFQVQIDGEQFSAIVSLPEFEREL